MGRIPVIAHIAARAGGLRHGIYRSDGDRGKGGREMSGNGDSDDRPRRLVAPSVSAGEYRTALLALVTWIGSQQAPLSVDDPVVRKAWEVPM